MIIATHTNNVLEKCQQKKNERETANEDERAREYEKMRARNIECGPKMGCSTDT